MRSRRTARRFALLALGAAAWSCARLGGPPGGPDDRRPPVVVSVEPDTFAIVEPGLDRLQVRFNERISEQAAGGSLMAAVEISPEVPDYRVDHDRQGLDIQIPGGLRPGITYRVRVSPMIQDMFNNPMAVPFEWVFSTGGEFTENAVVGQVWDRTNGEFLDGVRVALQPTSGGLDSLESDSLGADTAAPEPLVYVSSSGDEGLFALRSVPAGSFEVVALLDRNNNREPDGSEAIGRGEVESLGPADTIFLSLSVLVPDTTPAVLVRAEPLDSSAVTLTFDDFIDPAFPLDEATFRLAPLPEDSLGVLPPQPEGPLPEALRVFHAAEWEVYEDSLAVVADSLELLLLDSLAAAEGELDPEGLQGGPPPDSAEGPLGEPGELADGPTPDGQEESGIDDELRDSFGADGRTLPDGSPRPDPTVVVLLDGALPAGIEVEVIVEGVRNLNGLEEGGGSRPVTWTPPVPDTIPVDSLPPDSLGPLPDTAGLPPGTAALQLEPAGVPPDTAGFQSEPGGLPWDTARRRANLGGVAAGTAVSTLRSAARGRRPWS